MSQCPEPYGPGSWDSPRRGKGYRPYPSPSLTLLKTTLGNSDRHHNRKRSSGKLVETRDGPEIDQFGEHVALTPVRRATAKNEGHIYVADNSIPSD